MLRQLALILTLWACAGALIVYATWSYAQDTEPEPKRCRDFPTVVEEQQTRNLICGVIRCGDRVKALSCVLIPLEEIE